MTNEIAALVAHFRLTLLLQRFEVAAVAISALVLAALALVVSWRLKSVGMPLECFGIADVHGATGSSDPHCQALLTQFGAISGGEADRVFLALAAFPVLAGMLLGVPVVSREIENGTAILPWTLSGRRVWWLGHRTIELAIVAVVILVPLAVMADALEAARNPLVDPSRSFLDDSVRGPVVVARGLAGLAVGALLGLVTGRQLPAVILGLVASLVIVLGGLSGVGAWSENAARYVAPESAHLGDLSIRAALRGHDGKIVSFNDVLALQPALPGLPPGTVDDKWIEENFNEVLLVVPGDRYGESVLVQSGLLLSAALVASLASLALVDRRRIR
jgi:hypothetical protein